jgi:YVTN family beta-propeller protein
VSVIDGASNTVIATVPIGVRAFGLGLNLTTNHIYVGRTRENFVTIIDGTSNTVVDKVQVGVGPTGIGVNPRTNRVYVSNYHDDNTVSVIADAPVTAQP